MQDRKMRAVKACPACSCSNIRSNRFKKVYKCYTCGKIFQKGQAITKMIPVPAGIPKYFIDKAKAKQERENERTCKECVPYVQGGINSGQEK